MDDPDCSDVIAVTVHVAPKSSSSSSTSSGHPLRSCSRCLGRMSSLTEIVILFVRVVSNINVLLIGGVRSVNLGLRRSFWRMSNIVNRLLQNLRAGVLF